MLQDRGTKETSKGAIAGHFKQALSEASAAIQQRRLTVAEHAAEREAIFNVVLYQLI